MAGLLALGYSSVLAGNAAEAGALALAGGGDARTAAREALPGWSRARAQFSVEGGDVDVRITATSDQWQAFLAKAPADFFGEPTYFTRIGPSYADQQ